MSVARARLSQVAIESISSFLNRECGLVFSANKLYLFEQRLPPLLVRHGLDSLDALAHELLSNAVLRRDVIHQMTTHETSFFRDQAQFTALAAKVIPEVLAGAAKKQAAKQRHRPFIWSSACSTGQEPYSLAMLVTELAPNVSRVSEGSPSILATDISSEVLSKAKQGVFSELEVKRGLSEARLESFFRETPQGFEIAQGLRSMIDFRPMNLTRPLGALGTFDLVLCRNALIYFSKETATRTIDRIAQTQPSGGYLMLGASESMYPVHEAYREVSLSGLVIYRRR